MTRTYAYCETSFNSRPHEEVDAVRVRSLPGFRPFNSRPHEEVDLTSQIDNYEGQVTFNSRPHEEVDGGYV